MSVRDARYPGQSFLSQGDSMKRTAVLMSVVMVAVLASLPPSGAQAPKTAGAKKIGASIDGYRFEFPCKNPMPANPKAGEDCESGLVKGDPKKTDNFTAVRKFDGEKGKRYQVSL